MVHIITDTTACLPEAIAKQYDIPVIPQIINFGEESFYEERDIDNPTFMSRLRTSSELPKTAAPPPELFVEEFRRLSATNKTILCIHPSAEVSGTVRSATVAAQDFPDLDIRVIDTRVIASPLGTMVEFAARWAAEGRQADWIVTQLDSMIQRCRVYFLVDTLEYLAKGGRIGGASALLGSVLRVKPILTVRNGRVDQYERERTHQRAVKRLIQIVLEQIPENGEGYLSVMHAGVPEQANNLANELSVLVNQPVVTVHNVPPAIVTHGGPGILGTGFFVR